MTASISPSGMISRLSGASGAEDRSAAVLGSAAWLGSAGSKVGSSSAASAPSDKLTDAFLLSSDDVAESAPDDKRLLADVVLEARTGFAVPAFSSSSEESEVNDESDSSDKSELLDFVPLKRGKAFAVVAACSAVSFALSPSELSSKLESVADDWAWLPGSFSPLAPKSASGRASDESSSSSSSEDSDSSSLEDVSLAAAVPGAGKTGTSEMCSFSWELCLGLTS